MVKKTGMSNDAGHNEASVLAAALDWQLEQGIDTPMGDTPVNRLKPPAIAPTAALPRDNQRDNQPRAQQTLPPQDFTRDMSSMPPDMPQAARGRPSSTAMLGSAAARVAAEKAALAANTLDELRQALTAFDGLSIRETALNCVFCDGNPKADIMVVGEAPGGDEDVQGKPFVGASGQLIDKYLSFIGLSRQETDPHKAVYISNIVNWRPPGNRTPTPQEMDISLPFIERHIALMNPKILLLVGNVPTKTLLQSKDGITKLRGNWQQYQPTHADNQALLGNKTILTMPTLHPAFLLRAPQNKKTVWQDMLTLQQKRIELGLLQA